MAEKVEVEMYVLVDRDGDYAVGKDQAAAAEAYENDIQALAECGGYRMVKVRLAVALPAEVEVTAEVGQDDTVAATYLEAHGTRGTLQQ